MTNFERQIEQVVYCHRAKAAVVMVTGLFTLALAVSDRLNYPRPLRAEPVEAVALSEGQEPRDHYRGLPPPEFRGEWTGTVRFVDDVKAFCGENAYACAGKVITMPNPCTPDQLAEVGWSSRSGSLVMLSEGSKWYTEEYRTTMCHEIGHANGWPGNHWIAGLTEVAALRDEMLGELYERDQIDGGMDERSLLGWTVGWSNESLAGDAAIAEMTAANEVDVFEHISRGTVVRLTRCKYWTMRQEREGDGAARMKEACPNPAP